MSTESDINKLKTQFNEMFKKFSDQCIPICHEEDIYYFFASSSKQIYGIDLKSILFEPNNSVKYRLIKNYNKQIINDKMIANFNDEFKVNFKDLLELVINNNYLTNNFGKLYFYSKDLKTIFIWNNLDKLWIKENELNKINTLFINFPVCYEDKILDEKKILIKMNFEELGVNLIDLEELKERFRDGCIHYYHQKSDKIYSKIINKNSWFLQPDEQKKIILNNIKK